MMKDRLVLGTPMANGEKKRRPKRRKLDWKRSRERLKRPRSRRSWITNQLQLVLRQNQMLSRFLPNKRNHQPKKVQKHSESQNLKKRKI
jgi:hypothetical protein